jgi:peptide/nickel transport system ATP-binding protein
LVSLSYFAEDTNPSVLSVEELEISVRTSEGPRVLVQDLSFDLARGETLAIAGESGSGKSELPHLSAPG